MHIDTYIYICIHIYDICGTVQLYQLDFHVFGAMGNETSKI